MALTTRLPSAGAQPFHGFVETTGDALRLIEAARLGLIPRITRRLNDIERRAMVRSGSVFIFSKEESGIKRWTEGLSWSASRIVGNFLVYREVTERGVGRSGLNEGDKIGSRRRINFDHLPSAEQADRRLERSLVGCLSDARGRFKPGGLIKKTITVKVEDSEHHLIAYYNQEDVRLGRLTSPSSRPDIMALGIPPELLESTKFRLQPITEPGSDGRPMYICDADEQDPAMPSPLPLPATSSNSSRASSARPPSPAYNPISAGMPPFFEMPRYLHTPVTAPESRFSFDPEPTESWANIDFSGFPPASCKAPELAPGVKGDHPSEAEDLCYLGAPSLTYDAASFEECSYPWLPTLRASQHQLATSDSRECGSLSGALLARSTLPDASYPSFYVAPSHATVSNTEVFHMAGSQTQSDICAFPRHHVWPAQHALLNSSCTDTHNFCLLPYIHSPDS